MSPELGHQNRVTRIGSCDVIVWMTGFMWQQRLQVVTVTTVTTKSRDQRCYTGDTGDSNDSIWLGCVFWRLFGDFLATGFDDCVGSVLMTVLTIMAFLLADSFFLTAAVFWRQQQCSDSFCWVMASGF